MEVTAHAFERRSSMQMGNEREGQENATGGKDGNGVERNPHGRHPNG